MIRTTRGNILQADTEAVVNTVNTIGIMGKGIALQFKDTFPQNFLEYQKASKNGEVIIGKMFVTETRQLTNPRYIINFPTKAHWRERSRYEYIEQGLDDLVHVIKEKKIRSIAIPPLGCGNGGLHWGKVRDTMMKKLSSLTDVDILLYEPTAQIVPVASRVPNPHLTDARAMVLALVKQYTLLGYEVTILEMQKLAYFLQRFGENLKLQYKVDTYGPYAYNLTYLLMNLEGTYFRSKKRIADTKPFDKISMVADKLAEVETYISENCTEDQKERLSMVSELIQGFESPLGMELLATVDWVLNSKKKDQRALDRVIPEVHSWNERKKTLMKPEYIRIAYDRLIEFDNALYARSK